MKHQILVQKRRNAGEPPCAIKRVERREMRMPATEHVNDSVAADDVRDGLGRLLERMRLIPLDPLENFFYIL